MRKDMMNDMAEMLEAVRRRRMSRVYDNEYLPGDGNPRDGHGANGPRSEDVGAQRAQSGLGCAERVRDRRLVHDIGRRVRIRRSPTWRSRRAPPDFAVDELNRQNL